MAKLSLKGQLKAKSVKALEDYGVESKEDMLALNDSDWAELVKTFGMVPMDRKRLQEALQQVGSAQQLTNTPHLGVRHSLLT